MTLDNDKPLTPRQDWKKRQKGLMDYLPGNDRGPIVFRLKQTTKAGESLLLAILRLICSVKLGARQAKGGDIRSQFRDLTAIGLLPIPMMPRFENLSYERVD